MGNIEDIKRVLLSRARGRLRSMRNSGIYSQKEYEEGIRLARFEIKEYNYDMGILMRIPIFSPYKRGKSCV